jgi:hypothetical protein
MGFRLIRRYIKIEGSEIDKLLEWLHGGKDVNGNKRES